MTIVDEDVATGTTTAPLVTRCDIGEISSSTTTTDPARIVDPGGGPRLDDLGRSVDPGGGPRLDDLARLADLDWTTLDPSAPGYFDDPTVQLGALRERDAVHHVSSTDSYLVTRYEHVQALARDRRLGAATGPARSAPAVDAVGQGPGRIRHTEPTLLGDGPDHDRVRRVMQRAFTPKSIAELQRRAVVITDRLLDDIAAAGGGDLIGEYARRLPAAVIAEMVGVPTDDVSQLTEWSHDVTASVDPMCAPADRTRADVAAQALADYVGQLYEAKRARPDDGLLSHMIAADADGDRMTEDETVANTILLFVAGHETTTNLIGNGAVQLLRHPDQRKLLVADPSLDGNVVEEVLRYESPVQMTQRVSHEDIEVARTTIAAGSTVVLCSASANRDPRKWGRTADEFRIDRADAADQVSFGGGPHHCMGAALARMQGRVAIPRLFRRFPTLTLIAEPRFEERLVLRGVGRLCVAV